MGISPASPVRGLARGLVYRIMLSIAVLGAMAFPIMYLLNRPPSTFLPRAGVLKPTAPRFSFMIYGAFGEGQLQKPMDVTVSGQKIFVADTGNQRVQVFDYDGNFLFRFGKRGNGQGEFQFPYGLAADSLGNVYVADLYRGRISVFDNEGNFLRYLPEGKEKLLDGPGDLLIADDQLYVTDINKSQVLVFDLNGQLLRTVGQPGREPGQLRAPNGVAVDRDGNLHVVDTGNARVQVFSPDGKFLRLYNGSPDGRGQSTLLNPRGIAMRGNVTYVVSNLTHTVFGFDKEGKQLFAFGEMGTGNTQFMLPNGAFVDANGRFYITDTTNQRVAVYQ